MAIRRVDFNDEAVPATACEFSLIGLQLAYINHSQGSKQHQPAHHATNTTPVGSCNDFSRASVPARQCHPRTIRNFCQPRERIPPAYCTLLLPPATLVVISQPTTWSTGRDRNFSRLSCRVLSLLPLSRLPRATRGGVDKNDSLLTIKRKSIAGAFGSLPSPLFS